nr:hypothetical protein 13 [bacterium]
MSKYKVKQTDILHNGKIYPEGSEIELNDKQAKMIADYLELIEVIKKQQSKPAKATQQKTNTAKEPEKQEKTEDTPAENKEEKTQNNEGAKPQNFVPPNMRRE